MAVQSAAQRKANYEEFMRRDLFPGTVSKAQLRTAYDETDDWVDTAKAGAVPATSFRNALSEPYKTDSSPEERFRLWRRVLRDRIDLSVF